MYVSLFFDVEDCVTPLSDDIAKDLADVVSRHGLVADFLVVGDKARTLEQRGRTDVINALRRHSVGLHTNRHSRHPTVAEYLEAKGWDDGIDEAVRREGPGVETITRLFDVAPACWGQGGGSWGPQVHPAMRRLGVPTIVYPATRTQTCDVHWFGGVLTFGYQRCFEGFDYLYSDDQSFHRIFQAFQTRVAANLRAGYPWMGVFCGHPITVRAREFGDVLNFGRGRETPPHAWQQPPLKSEEEYRTALTNFGVLITYIAGHPQLQVLPVGSLREQFGRVRETVDVDKLLGYAAAALQTEDIVSDDPHLSAAEAVDVLVQAILAWDAGNTSREFNVRHVDGPMSIPAGMTGDRNVSWSAFRAGCDWVREYIDRTRQLPASVKIDASTVGIGDFYRAACESVLALAVQQVPQWVALRPGLQVPSIAEGIAARTERGYRGWVIHKPDLRVDKLLELTRLQTWTLKRAAC
jgi:peptidoglycan/xylan/chitin deacetylase (PgdA/CDA1 family)